MMPEMPLAAAAEPQGYYTSVYSGEEIDAAIGALLSNVTIYSATSTYEQGAYVLYDGQLYTANQTISSPEPWNPAHWTKVNILDVLKNAATRAVPAAAGNLAALTADGNLADSGKSPDDFAPAALTGDITIYVDSTHGNDANDGASQASAFRTFICALSKIPRNLGGFTATVILSGTFPEQFFLSGFFGGILAVQSAQGSTAAFTGAGIIRGNSCTVQFSNLSISGNSSSHPIIVQNTECVQFDSCTFDASAGGNGPVFRSNGLVSMRDCSVSHAAMSAVLACSGLVTIQNLSGSDNGTGLLVGNAFYSEIGIVIATGLTLTAAAQISVQLDSILFLDGTLFGGG